MRRKPCLGFSCLAVFLIAIASTPGVLAEDTIWHIKGVHPKGHWLDIKDHRIGNYQCVVPTTWNCSPRDDGGTPGAMEQALVGTPVADPQNPLEAARVIRSFDPCIACAVH